MHNQKHSQKRFGKGVTLVEIAIVLVIIGLLLGGVLKGQELINSAKIRSIADRQSSLKIAWFAFIDRYQGLPGDYVFAAANIPGAATSVDSGDGLIDERESPLGMQHLTAAGFIRCPQCTFSDPSGENPAAKNSLTNQYGGVMAIFHQSVGTSYAAIGGAPAGTRRLFVHTGPLLPSNIISEVDRKVDDGLANTGDILFSLYAPTGSSQPVPIAPNCMSLGADGQSASAPTGGLVKTEFPQFWRGGAATPPVEPNCGAVIAI